MDVNTKEKEWLRRMNGNHTDKKEEKDASKSPSAKQEVKEPVKKRYMASRMLQVWTS